MYKEVKAFISFLLQKILIFLNVFCKHIPAFCIQHHGSARRAPQVVVEG